MGLSAFRANEQGETAGPGTPLLPFKYRPFCSEINCLAKKQAARVNRGRPADGYPRRGPGLDRAAWA